VGGRAAEVWREIGEATLCFCSRFALFGGDLFSFAIHVNL
jgi:hypothetical protein